MGPAPSWLITGPAVQTIPIGLPSVFLCFHATDYKCRLGVGLPIVHLLLVQTCRTFSMPVMPAPPDHFQMIGGGDH